MAVDHFLQVLDWARRQGALSWELRAAASLARVLCDQGRSVDATALLQPVYDRLPRANTARGLLDVLRYSVQYCGFSAYLIAG
jgi:predicted ATPase